MIEGYGDGTYRGDQEITRYEMAQMIARAMAKGGGDKALIDKLAAEFADELNNLGVRVAALEKKVDNVKWYGLFRYTYERGREENDGFDETTGQAKLNHQNTNNFRLRLSMTAKVNEHWTANGRMEYAANGAAGDQKNMDTAANSNTVVVNRVWAQGQYGKTTIMLGKFPYFTDVDGGMIFDDDLAGGFVQFGDKANVKLLGARYDARGITNDVVKTVSMAGVELNSDPTKKFTYGVGYHYISNKDDMKNKLGSADDKYNAESMNIWSVGLGYRFDKNAKLFGTYAKNTSGDLETKHRQAWAVQFDYKGSDISKPGSWGAFVAYRHLGSCASIVPTYNSMFTDKKGVNFGVNFVPLKNIKAYVEYFTGKGVWSDKRQDTIFGRVELFF